MTEITFHPDVVKEVKASYIWYQNQAKGLGKVGLGFESGVRLRDCWF